ncbi:U4/U6.U5 tri-snRNP-associated protein 2-like [Nilaparvata lugens]|uniref:U4/U6.U5 tri-snRNP-associated protein 2-like n=1 Tax=Nilaparvata lugens TaxID=108931 RepID=UPI00193CCF8B|nr:U4/U6.U5 tri-snRNP-associated protein 2-like [Nilaparvata lugens]
MFWTLILKALLSVIIRINVYACLVCGKYFQGRGMNTHAYTHSVAESHHVFLNLLTLKFYCLPDNYEIVGE